MSSIGSVLKEARVKKSISLEEVHTKIKIHPRVIQLLEEDKFEKLPSPLFVKSFLKSYADFLEVNAEELLQAYQKIDQRSPDQVLFIRSADEREQEAQRQSSSTPRKVLIALVLGIVGASIIYLGYKHLNRLPHFSMGQFPIHVTIAGKQPQTAGSVRVGASLKEKAPLKHESSGGGKKSIDWLRSVQMGNFPVIDKRTPLDLKIKALDSVWMRVTCDGKVLYQGILKKGFADSWAAKESIEVWTGNASNIFLTLNRHALGSPGKGVIKRMIISHQGVRIAPSEVRS